MSTKCIQNVYIQNISHITRNFCRHFVYKISCHRFFNFVYKMNTKVGQNVYIFYTSVLYILHNFCIQNV